MKLLGCEIGGVPDTEFSNEFVQGMLKRMAMSFHKYGEVSKAYPTRVDAVGSLELRLERYKQKGNLEDLMDLANYAMIEFMYPRHPEAHLEAQDSHMSPGRKWHGEVDPSHRSNRIERMHE